MNRKLCPWINFYKNKTIREYMKHTCGKCKGDSDLDTRDDSKINWELQRNLVSSGQSYTTPNAEQQFMGGPVSGKQIWFQTP